MHVLPLVQSVRQMVLEGFRTLGRPDASLESLWESILICQGYYAGRKFFAGGLSALWLADRGQLVFFADGGAPIKVVPVMGGRKAA